MSGEGRCTTIVHYDQHAGSSPRTTGQFSFSTSTQSSPPDLLGQTCYLKLARGFAYTLHVNPPRDGGQRAVPEVLKGPSMSFYNLVSTHLLLKLEGVGHLLHAGGLLGSPCCPLVHRLLHAICLKDPR